MLKFWEKILWILFIVAILEAIAYIVWMFVNQYTAPFWMPLSFGLYSIIFLVYLIIRKRREHKD